MGVDYYCRMNGRILGPVSTEHLSHLVRYGRLKSDDLVREGPDGRWVRARSIPGLFGAGEAVAAAAPVVAGIPPPGRGASGPGHYFQASFRKSVS